MLDAPNHSTLYDHPVRRLDGDEGTLSPYRGQVLLIVNTASQCVFTRQYEGLEKLHRQYRQKGFSVLGFPCNQFGEQEPGTNEEIQQFCSSKYNVTFKLFDKVKVLGDDKTPLYNRLVNNAPETGDIGWNFEKFLIDKKGNIIGRYKSKVKPDSDELVSAINAELAK